MLAVQVVACILGARQAERRKAIQQHAEQPIVRFGRSAGHIRHVCVANAHFHAAQLGNPQVQKRPFFKMNMHRVVVSLLNHPAHFLDIFQQALLFGRNIKRVKARFFKPFLQKMRLADALANNVKCYSRHRLVCAIVCNHESNTAAVKPIGNMQNLHKLLHIPS